MVKVFLNTVQILVVLSLIFAFGCKKDEKKDDGGGKNQPPKCEIINPQNNAQFDMNESITVTVSAESSDGKIVEVRLFVDNVEHGITTEAPYHFTINGGKLSVGTHILKAVAKDDQGTTAESMVGIIIKQPGDGTNQPPTCIITNPQNNATFSTDENIAVTVVAEDADGYIVEVQLYVNNVGHSIKTSFPYNFTINSGELSPGTHTLKAVAKDDKGANGESTVSIIVEQPNTESPDFVSFSDGKIPNTWQTTAWFVDNTVGYDDIFSLRATTSNVAVITSKTCTSNINYVEFYVRSGFLNFFIDGVLVQECSATNNWKKYGFFLSEGLHTFKWESISSSVNIDAIRFKKNDDVFTGSIGDYYQGGIVFYIDATGKHGLIAAPQDQSTGTPWWNGSYIVTGATGTAIGTGRSNTTRIIQVQGEGGYAAKLCDDLVLNGYTDWFLPSKDELNLLYQNKDLIGGFATGSYDYYWSSSESSNINAWSQNFTTGNQYSGNNKNYTYRVRAVRAF
ncbi:MAG: Ig-like domain-containing protein [Bacteroidales bacterium]|nr:Ig-like domain-containing protein [Bacteroidales bacterium]